MRRAKRILVYAQHLSGVGHYVRILEIARALAQRHQVAFVMGGRPVPRPECGGRLETVEVPPIRRGPRGIEPLDPAGNLDAVLRVRAQVLGQAAARLAPDVLLIEHYPFSKWELGPEIDGLIDAARAANPDLEVVCSARDILSRTRHECVSNEAWQRRVVATLNERFDALLLHTDPGFTRLEEHFAAAGDLALRIAYTGFVSEKPGPAPADVHGRSRRPSTREGSVVVSTGGGSGSSTLVERVIEAWARLGSRGLDAGRELRVFAGLFWTEDEIAKVRERAASGTCVVLPFTRSFLRTLRGADLSISRAGYNTCTNLLETRGRALLLPDPGMSDQHFRARRFAAHGLAEVVADADPSVAELAEVIEAALRREPPHHDFALDGAQRTCELLSH